MSILTLIRHLTAVAVLPFTVTVLIPLWIVRGGHARPRLGDGALQLGAQLGGIGLAAVGLLLFGASLWQFVVHGRGTLAPWDPPTRLVVRGPYRYVRNPMISGVLFILFGEALALLSWPLGRWAAFFLLLNLVYIPLLEEPPLEARFGEPYREYCRHVRRFVPRVRPWMTDCR